MGALGGNDGTWQRWQRCFKDNSKKHVMSHIKYVGCHDDVVVDDDDDDDDDDDGRKLPGDISFRVKVFLRLGFPGADSTNSLAEAAKVQREKAKDDKARKVGEDMFPVYYNCLILIDSFLKRLVRYN